MFNFDTNPTIFDLQNLLCITEKESSGAEPDPTLLENVDGKRTAPPK